MGTYTPTVGGWRRPIIFLERAYQGREREREREESLKSKRVVSLVGSSEVTEREEGKGEEEYKAASRASSDSVDFSAESKIASSPAFPLSLVPTFLLPAAPLLSPPELGEGGSGSEPDDRHSSPQNTLGERFHTVRFYEREGRSSLPRGAQEFEWNEEIYYSWFTLALTGDEAKSIAAQMTTNPQNKASSRGTTTTTTTTYLPLSYRRKHFCSPKDDSHFEEESFVWRRN